MGFIKAFSFKAIMHFDLSLLGYSSLAPSSHPFPARPFLCPHSLSSTLNHIYKAHGRKCHVCPSESAHLSSDDHLQKHPLLQMTFFVAECHIFFICSFVAGQTAGWFYWLATTKSTTASMDSQVSLWCVDQRCPCVHSQELES